MNETHCTKIHVPRAIKILILAIYLPKFLRKFGPRLGVIFRVKGLVFGVQGEPILQQ